MYGRNKGMKEKTITKNIQAKRSLVTATVRGMPSTCLGTLPFFGFCLDFRTGFNGLGTLYDIVIA